MKGLPRWVIVGPVRYRLVVDGPRAEDCGVAFGRMDEVKAEILLAPGQAIGQARDTLLHEVLHACLAQLGVTKGDHPLVGEGSEEPLVHGLSAVLLDTLRRNPGLVKFLLAADSA